MNEEDQSSVEIPQPDYGEETPAEALESILLDTIKMAKEMGSMTDDEVNLVLEKVLNDRAAEFRKNTFKVHDKNA